MNPCTVESVHVTIQRTLDTIDRTDLNAAESRNLDAFTTAMEIFARERRISQVPNLESEVRERRVEKIEEDITERQSGRFSVKKTPEKGWKKVQQIAVRLSAEKYTENVDQQKTMETFINDNEEDRETAQSLEDRFHQGRICQLQQWLLNNQFSFDFQSFQN